MDNGHTPLSITSEQLETYRKDGFLIIPDALSRFGYYQIKIIERVQVDDNALDILYPLSLQKHISCSPISL